MDYKDISERIALLTQEIRELQRIEPSDGNHRTNHEQRELRLKQIQGGVVEDDVETYTTRAVMANSRNNKALSSSRSCETRKNTTWPRKFKPRDVFLLCF
jgi:hypothetical protein